MPKPTPLRKLLDVATTEQRIELAEKSEVSAFYLLHLAAGRRHAGGRVAGNIRRAADAIPGLPKLKQTELSNECAGCDYAKRCEK